MSLVKHCVIELFSLSCEVFFLWLLVLLSPCSEGEEVGIATMILTEAGRTNYCKPIKNTAPVQLTKYSPEQKHKKQIEISSVAGSRIPASSTPRINGQQLSPPELPIR